MAKKQPIFSTRIDLSIETRQTCIELLNQTLADLSDLFTQTKQAHWNVRGINFYQLHELFDEMAAALLPLIDETAERTTALGGKAKGTARMAAANSSLPELELSLSAGPEMVKALADRYGIAGNNARAAIDKADKAGDADTADLLTGVSRELDKQLWFLEAHLEA